MKGRSVRDWRSIYGASMPLKLLATARQTRDISLTTALIPVAILLSMVQVSVETLKQKRNTEKGIMNSSPRSLHSLVDKWLAPTPTTSIHVTRFRSTSSLNGRYVRVETARQTGTMAMFFFRHRDGWCVYPPLNNRMASLSRVWV